MDTAPPYALPDGRMEMKYSVEYRRAVSAALNKSNCAMNTPGVSRRMVTINESLSSSRTHEYVLSRFLDTRSSLTLKYATTAVPDPSTNGLPLMSAGMTRTLDSWAACNVITFGTASHWSAPVFRTSSTRSSVPCTGLINDSSTGSVPGSKSLATAVFVTDIENPGYVDV